MTPKQVVLETLKGARPGRCPVALMAGGAWSARHIGSTLKDAAKTPETMSAMLSGVADTIKSDIVYVGSGYTSIHAASVCGIEPVWRDVGALDISDRVIKSGDDFAKLDPSMVDRHPLTNIIKEAYKLTRARIGDEYLVTITAWGPFTNGARMIGEETLIKGIYKNPNYIEGVIDFATDMLIHLFEPLVDRGGVEMILLGDPTASGDLISSKQFERFALPYLQRFTRWARSKNVMTMIHICGDTTDRLDLFPQTGAECISLDHKVNMRKAKEALKGAICFAGNLNPVEALMNGSIEDVERESRRLLETMGDDGGFILMPGCDIPPSVPLDNIKKMMEVGHAWKY
ncbi:MAG TPA: hypothetical protein ENI77_09860 [Nitrospirae bacterium]|nr:hypothetical protein [Nitrospirota bacterium]